MNGPRPVILPPFTPSELLQHLVAHTTYPTTVVIAWHREEFVNALAEDIRLNGDEDGHPLLKTSLFQTAVSRHLNIVFTPTVTHLRVFLGAFTLSDIRVRAPPSQANLSRRPAMLMVYGMLELHRDGTEWSAQGLGTSAAMLVEGALRDGFRAVMTEPRKMQDADDELAQSLREHLPVLKGTPVKENGSWGGPTVAVSQVLGTWFRKEASQQNS